MSLRLAGHGRLPWPRVRELIGAQDCAWADLDGFQLGPAPDTAPPYSHLWSWSPGRWVRVRIDGAHGIVGILSPTGPGDDVEVHLQPGHPWRPLEDQRIAPLPPTVLAEPWHLLVVGGLRPITFVHRGPPPHLP
jgi:hypothetical protein